MEGLLGSIQRQCIAQESSLCLSFLFSVSLDLNTQHPAFHEFHKIGIC